MRGKMIKNVQTLIYRLQPPPPILEGGLDHQLCTDMHFTEAVIITLSSKSSNVPRCVAKWGE